MRGEISIIRVVRTPVAIVDFASNRCDSVFCSCVCVSPPRITVSTNYMQECFGNNKLEIYMCLHVESLWESIM